MTGDCKNCETSKMTEKTSRNAPLSEFTPGIQKLLKEAVEARNFAYAPYSNFKVGAAVLCEDGSIVRGCNVENVSFTVGFCAERVAYVKAISEGKMKFKAVAVIAQQEKFITTPCGACRQFMSEFGNIDVYCAKPDLKDIFATNTNLLLPHQFETEGHAFK